MSENKMDKIMCLAMTDGSHVVAEVVKTVGDDERRGYLVKAAMIVALVQDPKDPRKIGVNMSPLLPPFTDKPDQEVFLKDELVAFTYKYPNVDVLNRYNQLFGSGLTIASGNVLPFVRK